MKVIKMYFIIGIPIIFALSFLGHDLLVLTASKKYEEGFVVIPFIVVGYMLHKANFLYGAGLYLSKKTGTLLMIIACSAVINIILNIILIPIWGLYGAATTTLIAYLFEVILLVNVSFHKLSFKIPIYSFIKYIFISIVMVCAMLLINNLGPMQIFVRIIVGFLTYCSGILLFEAQLRTKTGILLYKIFSKWAISSK